MTIILQININGIKNKLEERSSQFRKPSSPLKQNKILKYITLPPCFVDLLLLKIDVVHCCSFPTNLYRFSGFVCQCHLCLLLLLLGPWKKRDCRGPATITRLPSLFINQIFHNIKLLQPYDVCRHKPEPFYGPDCYICEH